MIITMHHCPMRSFGKAISTVMTETEKEERNIILDANNMNMNTFCQSLVKTNTHDIIFYQVTHQVGESEMNYIKRF